MLSPTHHQLLDETLDHLRADPAVAGVLLSGSLARGTARPDSDLDLLVVTTGDLTWHPGGPVDLIARTADQWRSHVLRRADPTETGRAHLRPGRG